MKNPKYSTSSDINQSKFIDVPCGKCAACLSNKRRDWFVRLMLESTLHDNNLFVTLTYDEENLPKDSTGKPCFNKRHVQLYFKRLRKSYKFRYFLCSEYGKDSKRPHYHFICFGAPDDPEFVQALDREWHYGFTSVSRANPARMNYCCKYVLFKSDVPEGSMKPFILASKSPALGAGFFDRNLLSILPVTLLKMITELVCTDRNTSCPDCLEISSSLTVTKLRISPGFCIILHVLPMFTKEISKNDYQTEILVQNLLNMLNSVVLLVKLKYPSQNVVFEPDDFSGDEFSLDYLFSNPSKCEYYFIILKNLRYISHVYI